MDANEIIVGKDYIVKVGHNDVKVKVLNHTGHSWIVKTAGGKIMPIQMADRFVRQLNVEPESIVPTTEAAVPSVAPTDAVTAATEATTPAEPATLPPPAVPSSAPVTPVSATTEKKLSMLDAAAKVLETAIAPMTVKEILTAMEETGLWKPGKGLTPDRTLIAGISVEIKKKPNPRFRKTAPGTFEYIGGERHE